MDGCNRQYSPTCLPIPAAGAEVSLVALATEIDGLLGRRSLFLTDAAPVLFPAAIYIGVSTAADGVLESGLWAAVDPVGDGQLVHWLDDFAEYSFEYSHFSVTRTRLFI